ncbi:MULTISPECIES: threonine--tRNA ligase [Hydrocarboniphaga]|uniref:Threonine--tRNA ligase n=1 Tax=Hydrocarboniphaga effusa AP103 TaxID=1172194 RepID=I8HYU3_9GAMM|nr:MULTISPECIES: threonine--tRNA ligase [Hydrocarboniphaga]EIT68661.1 Threonyl-tRNA synthetase [Hydrocarboniphaga effusa AP103]MDZ4076820.1 threonine--tRNA ligase [Hydrocarboniphaga sp.]
MSIQITFPDGNVKSYDAPPTGLSIAQGISPGLAKKAALIKLDGELYDLTRPIERSAAIEIVTRDKPEVLDVIRHDAAHVLAQAVQELFPGTQITFGPSTDVGFYYDFARSEPFSESDLEVIEARMRDIVKRDLPITREVWPREQVIEFFEKSGEKFKAEWVSEGIAAGEEISIYRQGQDWLDMCRGPHLASTAKLGTAFKLTKVSGAYWRGDANNAQLQRIYGVAFATDDELKAYLKMVEEAEKRDHRKLAKQLDLFHQQEEAPGMVFWHPKGWAIWQAVEQYVRGVYRRSGYQEVRGPQIMDVSLWKRSGHWDNYQENMFFTESEKRTYAVKPMNCPGHVQIYNAGLRSYRDLPIRYGEFGGCHRNEPSGGLHGIMRVRAFTQDDGHIFCTPEQVEGEVTAFHQQAMKVYADFGFDTIAVKLALRPDKRLGTEEAWDHAENSLRAALRAAGVEWEELPGEGAFYGPKIEYHMKDSIGRSWQVGTMQFDPMMPERLDAEYVDEHSQKRRPIMLHRAIVGSMERFIGILIEHHAGAMPLWLAPVQAVVAPIVSDADGYATEVCEALKDAGLRADTDLRNEKINYKIREHSVHKVPVIVVVGRKEAEEKTVTLRRLGVEYQKTMPLAEAIALLSADAKAPA